MRIALIAPYWSFFEASVPGDLRADQDAITEQIAGLLRGAGAEVCAVARPDSLPAGAAAGSEIAGHRPDAVIAAVSMCVPPGFALAALEAVDRVPLVVAAVFRPAGPRTLDHATIVSEGATVGVAQLTSALHRDGRAHQLSPVQLGREDDLARFIADTQAAAAAGAVRRTRILQVGQPIEGYDCVACDLEQLRAATGITTIAIHPGRVRAAYAAATSKRAQELADETRATFAVSDELPPKSLMRTMRFAAALEALDDELVVDAGAMNCHVPEIRLGDEPGLAPCFALGRETSRGVPWSCAGDIPVAVAMRALKLVGGSALYHEIEALDREHDLALIANSGEHDTAFADPARPLRLVPNRWWAADRHIGGCACFGPPPGPGTLVAFTPHRDEPSGFRFVTAEGTFVPRGLQETGTPHAAFRFNATDGVTAAWSRWIDAGVSHHSAASPAHHGRAIAHLSKHLGLGCVQIS